jgi:hypothetical protein
LSVSLAQRQDRAGEGSIRATSLKFIDAHSHQILETIISGQDIIIEIAYETLDIHIDCIEDLMIGLAFYTELGQFVAVLNSKMASSEFKNLPPNGSVYCHVPKFPLMEGHFSITVTLVNGLTQVDQVIHAHSINVQSADFFGTGLTNSGGRQGVYINQAWSQSTSNLKASKVISDSVIQK